MNTSRLLLITAVMIFVVVSGALACKSNYMADENVVIYDIIEDLGDTADCNISIYNNNTMIDGAVMLRHGLMYTYDAGVLNESSYVANIQCNKTNNATSYSLFLSECKFTVGEVDGKMMIALGIFVFITLAGFLYLAMYINNIRVDFEKITTEESANKFKKIKTDFVIKALWVFTSFVMLLTVVGFAYYAAQSISSYLASLVMVYWIVCFIGIMVMGVLMVFKMFTFPFNAIGEFIEQQKRYNRR
jgi:cytochrome c biogenesis protein CcdA